MITKILTADRNERNYWVGLLLLFIGLAGLLSVFMALAVAGGVMIVESMLTSYLAGLINSRSD